jgi:hypothetical protein
MPEMWRELGDADHTLREKDEEMFDRRMGQGE